MSRRRVRSAEYRRRRQKRHSGRHYFIDQPISCDDCTAGLPHSAPCTEGSRITEYRRGQVVGLEIIPAGWSDEDDCLDRTESDHRLEVSIERGNQRVQA